MIVCEGGQLQARDRKVSFTDVTVLEDAIKSENLAELSCVLDGVVDAAEQQLSIHGEHALHVCVKKDRLEATRCILAISGININMQDEDGETALHYAVANDNLPITTLLLDHGADLFQLNDHGILPSSMYKSTEMKVFLDQKLFEAAADINRLLQRRTSMNDPANLGNRRMSDSDLMSCTNKRKVPRSRTLSDGGLPDKPLRGILKKSAQTPRVSLIKEMSQESLFSEQQEEKRQKIGELMVTEEEGSDVKQFANINRLLQRRTSMNDPANLGNRRMSDSDLMSCTNKRKVPRSRTLSDGGLPDKPLRGILKKSAQTPRVSLIKEMSQESLFSEQQEEKRQKIGELMVTEEEGSDVKQFASSVFNFKAIWRTRRKLLPSIR
eukprot:sb/3465667/